MSRRELALPGAPHMLAPLRSVLVCLCALGAVLALPACSKKQASEGQEAAPSPLPKAEAERGMKACEAYVARLCACAETHPELAEDCTLAKARPQAFALNLELSATAGLESADQTAVKVEARKIAAGCFEADSKLDPEMCPRL